jgi:hypothetical protein
VGTVEASAGVSFTGGAICALVATVDGERKLGAVKTVVASRHWLRPFLDRIGEYRWGVAAEGEPRT